MLKKLINLELKFRGKTTLIMYALLLFSTPVMIFVNNLDVKINAYPGSNIDNFFSIIACMYIVIVAASLFYLVYFTISDFNNRYFKDQSYLTHTLPVKSGTMLNARLLLDSVLVLITWLISLFCLDTLSGENGKYFLEFFDNLIYWGNDPFIYELMDWFDKFFCILLYPALILFLLWHFYAAYAMGHMFSNSKKAWSALIYVVIMIVVVALLFIIYTVSDYYWDAAMYDRYTTMNNHKSNGDLLSLVNMLTDFAVLALFIGVTLGMKAMINYVFKKRLNLE